MPAILSRYIAMRLLSSIAVSFLIFFAIVYLIDFVNLLQDMAQNPKANIFEVAFLGLIRAPVVVEQTFPFTMLFAAIATFVGLSRKMELVVARGTGVSIWQILTPALLAAAFVGIVMTAVYNPAATRLKEYSEKFSNEVFDRAPSTSTARWLRQLSSEDQSIVRAERSSDRGRTLGGVTAFVFTPKEGAFRERIEATAALLHAGYWELQAARVMRPGMPPESHPVYRLATNLTFEQVAETVSSPDTISFWELPPVISQWQASGIQTRKFELKYQSLIARPALYASMVLIAAMVSLGLACLGGVSRAILGGVLTGFVLYVAGEMAGDLGAAGFIMPVVAAWAPPIIGVMLSVTVLLYREDG
jgi:lipopolysaccharide export system permease protein